MDDLATWLRGVLDEDAERTRNLLAHAQRTNLTLKDPRHLGKFIPGWHAWPQVEQMCHERLADVEAKRRILDAYEQAWRNVGEHPGDLASEGAMLQMITVLKLLAQPYRDRPDFREEWIR